MFEQVTDGSVGGHLDWPSLPAAQQPTWPDEGALQQVRAELATMPPLVFAGECDDLRTHLALSLIHISEPTRRLRGSRMPSSA